MQHLVTHKLLSAVFLSVALGGALPVLGQYELRVGQAHPDFVLPRIDTGEAVAPSQFRGKKLLLIHFASW